MSTDKNTTIRRRGYPLPGGVSILQEGLNFSIFSRHASRVTLIIDHLPEGKMSPTRHEFELDPLENKTGDMWHILLKTHRQNFSYGYRIDGPDKRSVEEGESNGLVYDYKNILIDPYSRALLPRPWGNSAEYGAKPCCRIINDGFDWENDRPLNRDLSETVIYELHVRGFTRDISSGVSSPGTFLGMLEKIDYLKDLGVTAVELMPITEFDENDTVFHDPETGEKLKNFWGYNPVSFFAINSGYASDPARAVHEFKTMVKTFHRNGIEVYLDMVYNHTGEGGYGGLTSSFRGIDNNIYYLLNSNNEYHNFSGCGNTTNCNHPVVRDLIRESLRYWVTEMHVDGFRFDLASILGRDQQGNVLPNPPMIEIIGQDPVLRDTKMIAEAWDAAGLYQVGSFSNDPRWAEWNGRFRDDVRAFLAGHENSVTHLATRIAGSSDLYQTSGRNPLCSINFITSHDGFTLYDLVSYNDKHNRRNGEDNRDGDNHNISWNSGHEGDDCSREVQLLRFTRMKTFSVLLFFSQGVPMICAGDEFGRSQGGNNNSWCQDNETSWLNWELLQTNSDFHRFFKRCIALRKKYKIFRRDEFFVSIENNELEKDRAAISWQYLSPGKQDWSGDCHGLGFHLHGGRNQKDRGEFFVALNGNSNKQLTFTAPPPLDNKKDWYQIIHTGEPSPYDFTELEKAQQQGANKKIIVPPFACVVLQSG